MDPSTASGLAETGRTISILLRIACGVLLALATTASSSVCAEEPASNASRTGIQRTLQFVPHLMVAPNAPHSVPEPNAPTGGGDKTANICLELEAFLEQGPAQGASRLPAQNSTQTPPAPHEQSTTQSAAARGQVPKQADPTARESDQADTP